MSSVMETLSCWSLLLTSLEQQMLTELRTCQELYSTKERLSMTRVPSAPFLRRLASFFGSITLRGSLSPAITGPSPLWRVGGKGRKGRAGTPGPVSPRGTSEGIRGKQGSSRPGLLTLLTPRMPTHCAEPGKRGKEKMTCQLGRTRHSSWAKSPRAWPSEDAFRRV